MNKAHSYHGKQTPGPRGAPLLGSLVALRSNPLAAFTEWTRDFNPIARVRLGPLMCIGQSLAMLEGTMILERLLKVYRIELRDVTQPGLRLQAQVTLRPPVGVLVEVSRWKDGTLAA